MQTKYFKNNLEMPKINWNETESIRRPVVLNALKYYSLANNIKILHFEISFNAALSLSAMEYIAHIS